MMDEVTKELMEALKIVTSQLERVGDTRKHKDGEFIDLGREAIARAEASLSSSDDAPSRHPTDKDFRGLQMNDVTKDLLKAQTTVDAETVDRAWARFCGAFGDGPDAPYPGMIAAFETHYGQSFRDKEWRTEAACWAAAWSKAAARAESSLSAPQSDALEQVRAEEREACAKACDELFPPPGEQMAVEWAAGTVACANAIRARGQK